MNVKLDLTNQNDVEFYLDYCERKYCEFEEPCGEKSHWEDEIIYYSNILDQNF